MKKDHDSYIIDLERKAGFWLKSYSKNWIDIAVEPHKVSSWATPGWAYRHTAMVF